MITGFVALCAAMRVALGLAPILAPGPASRLLGFPPEHDNSTARIMGGLFGVRDVGLGALVFAALGGVVPLGFALLFNAAHDAGDACVIGLPVLRGEAQDRGARLSLLFAALGGLAWIVAWAATR